MRISVGLLLIIVVFPCMFSCAGTSNKSQISHVDLFDKDDSVSVEVFKGKPLSRIMVEVEARAAAVPYGTEDVLHVGTCGLSDSTSCGFAYVFSLSPESIDTVSATSLRYHFTLGRKGRLMLLSAKHPEGIAEALERLDRRIQKGWKEPK